MTKGLAAAIMVAMLLGECLAAQPPDDSNSGAQPARYQETIRRFAPRMHAVTNVFPPMRASCGTKENPSLFDGWMVSAYHKDEDADKLLGHYFWFRGEDIYGESHDMDFCPEAAQWQPHAPDSLPKLHIHSITKKGIAQKNTAARKAKFSWQSTTTLFIEKPHHFIVDAKRAKKVRIRPLIYQEGSPVFEFNVTGLDW
ncbi:MAG: hypothetical protein LBF61_02650 [Azoarcus sp.]|nr:hypothetical protein [Azoarcus sp.]